MISLEKKMFILPNRFYAMRDYLFVSFNLGNVPRDMKVTAMNLHVPLIIAKEDTTIYIKEIGGGWTERGIEKGQIPKFTKAKKVLKTKPKQKELVINVSGFMIKWNSKQNNHGIFIKLENKSTKYLEENPPFLIVDTI